VATVPVSAAVVTYTDESAFQTALTGSFTLANLDAAPFSAGAVSAGDAAFLSLGIDIVTPTTILNGQAFQLPKPGRDRMLVNGTGNGLISADFTLNFTAPQSGVGALPNVNNNIGDGGHIRVYSGLNLTGALLGEADFGVPTGSFGGITSDLGIRSVQITCEFDPDLDCGIYDLQFGTVAGGPIVVPIPAALPLFATALVGLGVIGWRRRRLLRRGSACQHAAS
jgi:hypothetical protein